MITMSTREEGRIRVLEHVLLGKLSQPQAAGLLEVSVRQMRRLQRRYGAQGGAGLVHKLRGQVSNRNLDVDLALHAQQLITAHDPPSSTPKRIFYSFAVSDFNKIKHLA